MTNPVPSVKMLKTGSLDFLDKYSIALCILFIIVPII